MVRLSRVFFVIVVGFIMASCSREMGNTAHVKFDLSKYKPQGKISAQSISPDQVNFVAINVSGPGIEPRIICRYDDNDSETSKFWTGGCAGSANNPLIVEIPEVPAGNNRLIQILLVTETGDSSSGGEEEIFAYGETTSSLQNGENLVPISVEQAPAATNMEGSAAGRYLSGGIGYTGKVVLEFVPPTANPTPMEVLQLEMYAGWFEIFLLDNVPLQYRMEGTDEILFGGPVGQNNGVFAGASQVLNLTTPQTFREDGDADGAQINILGFWSDGIPDPAGSVCYDTSTVNADYEFVDAAATVTLSWPSDFTIAGGSACSLTGDVVNSSQMKFGGELLLGNDGGRDNPLFIGPYQLFATSSGKYELLEAAASGPSLTVSWDYLPGVVGAPSFNGTTVYYSNTYVGNLEKELEGSDGLICQTLLSKGFSSIDVAAPAQTVNINVGSEDYVNKGLVVLCPRVNGNYFRRVVATGVRMPSATQLEISGTEGVVHPYINDNACTLLELQALDGSGYLGAIPGEEDGQVDYIVSLSDAVGGTFYNDGGCSSPIATMSMNNSYEFIWWKGSTTPGTNIDFAAETHFTESITLVSADWDVNIASASPAAGITIVAPAEIFSTTQCLPLLGGIVDSSGVPTYNSATLTITVTGSLGTFHSDISSCSSGSITTTMGIPPGYNYGGIGYQPTSPSGVEILDMQGNGYDAVDVPIELLTPPSADYMYLDGPNSGSGCVELYLNTYVSGTNGPNGSLRSFPPTPLNYQLSSTPSSSGVFDGFYSDPGCTAPLPSNQIGQTTTSSSVSIYVEASSTDYFVISVDELNTGNDEFDSMKTISLSP